MASGPRRANVAPFHAGPLDADSPRLILVAYHFPPGESAGAMRWERFARVGVSRGWGLDVLTVDPGSLPRADWSRVSDLPPNVRVFGVSPPRLRLDAVEESVWRAWARLRDRVRHPRQESSGRRVDGSRPSRPGSLGRREVLHGSWTPRSLARGYFAWAEYRRFGAWAQRAFDVGLAIYDPDVHVAVLSSSPPNMAHEGARRLAQRSGLPLVLDFRDPMSLRERIPESVASPLWYRLADRYERRLVKAARLIVMNTEPARIAMRALYPEASDRIMAVMTGFDPEEALPARPYRRFTIGFAGEIYLDRDPTPLFRAVGELARNSRLGPEDLGIAFMGTVGHFDGVSLPELAEAAGAGAYLSIRPPGSRAEALEFLSSAHILVSLPQDSELAIPSKIFDYMQLPGRILALAERGSATELLLRNLDADVISPRDVAGIATVLERRHREGRRDRPEPVALQSPGLSSRAQGERLFEALESRIDRRSP